VLLVDQRWPGDEFGYVGSDNVGGAALATRHLAKLGRRRIGFVRDSFVSTGLERWEGFLAEMRRLALPVDERFCPELSEADPFAYEAVKKLLSSPERPDALLCFNDYCAFSAFRAAAELGLAVPREIAIMGFGDLPILPGLVRPGLTSMDQRPLEIGRAAASALLDAIEGRSSGRAEIRLPMRVVERGSAGEPKGA
jgi:LacI family transcriptional regulator